MKIIRFSLILILVSVISYAFYYNPREVEIVYGSTSSIKAPMALVLISTFSAGALFTLFFALLVGIKFQFRTNRVEREKKQIDDHMHLIDRARSSLALGNYDEAEGLFTKIINRDPNNIGARVALSRALQERGEDKDALRVLDEARAEDKKNPELLLAASDLNARLGNFTAAYDNASMVLKMMPKNKFALQRLAEDCLPLEKFQEAAEYIRELIRLSSAEEIELNQEKLAEVEFMAAAKIENDEEFRSKMRDIVNRHKDFVPALEALADVEAELGNPEKAETALLKAFAVESDSYLLEKLGQIWIKASNPKRAISTLEKLIKDLEKSQKDASPARYALSTVQLELENLEAAESALKPILESNELDEIQVLEAKILAKRGNKDLAFKKLVDLFEKNPEHCC